MPSTATLRLNGLWERVLSGGVRFVSGDWADLGPLLDGPGVAQRREVGFEGGFDLILSAETIYSTEATPRLWRLIQQQLRYPMGTAARAKVLPPSVQRPSSARAVMAPQGRALAAPGGSRRPGRVRPGYWAPLHCLSCSSQPPRTLPIPPPLTT